MKLSRLNLHRLLVAKQLASTCPISNPSHNYDNVNNAISLCVIIIMELLWNNNYYGGIRSTLHVTEAASGFHYMPLGWNINTYGAMMELKSTSENQNSRKDICPRAAS
jgi:ABC-type uncharacterized transport system fused permease/ATPase subunit